MDRARISLKELPAVSQENKRIWAWPTWPDVAFIMKSCVSGVFTGMKDEDVGRFGSLWPDPAFQGHGYICVLINKSAPVD